MPEVQIRLAGSAVFVQIWLAGFESGHLERKPEKHTWTGRGKIYIANGIFVPAV